MEDGWYWAKMKAGYWEVVLRQRGLWYRAGIMQERTDEDNSFEKVGARLEEPVE